MIWRCLGGGAEKCSDNLSTGSNSTQPAISCGLCTYFSLTPSSEEGMGEDNFPSIRFLIDTHGGCAHLPDIEQGGIDASQCMVVILLYLFYQFIHRLAHPNLN